MATQNFPDRPRIIGANAHKFVGKTITVVGEVTSITPQANTLTLKLPDDESLIVLLQRNSTTIEPHRLTEVSGRLVSRGQMESNFIRQYDLKETSVFNRSLYVEAAHIYDAHRQEYTM